MSRAISYRAAVAAVAAWRRPRNTTGAVYERGAVALIAQLAGRDEDRVAADVEAARSDETAPSTNVLQ